MPPAPPTAHACWRGPPLKRQWNGSADSKNPDSFDGRLFTVALFTSLLCSVYCDHNMYIWLSVSLGA